MQLARRRRLGTTSALLAVLAILVLALLGGAAAFALTDRTWHSSASVTITPPQTGVRSRLERNPLLRLDDNLAQLVTVLATAMRSQSVGSTLQQQGGTADFTAVTGDSGADDTASALTPRLRFTTDADSPELARRTVEALVSVARDQLDRLQTSAGVPGAARATVSVLAAPTPAAGNSDARWTAAGRTALAVAIVLGTACWVRIRRRAGVVVPALTSVSADARRTRRGTPRPASGERSAPV